MLRRLESMWHTADVPTFPLSYKSCAIYSRKALFCSNRLAFPVGEAWNMPWIRAQRRWCSSPDDFIIRISLCFFLWSRVEASYPNEGSLGVLGHADVHCLQTVYVSIGCPHRCSLASRLKGLLSTFCCCKRGTSRVPPSPLGEGKIITSTRDDPLI